MKKIYFLALSCAIMLGLASCDPGEDKSQQVLYGYFSVVGSYPNYKFVEDGGTIVYPSPQSVADVTQGAGFGNNKRVQFTAYFYPKDMITTDDVTEVNNATLQQGSVIPVDYPITMAKAEKDSINVADSIFTVKSLGSWWVSNGYLTTNFIANYSVVNSAAIVPTTKLCLTSISDNAINFTLYYNRHTKKDTEYSEANFTYSFDITNISVPGNDSVTVTFDTEGIKSSYLKIPRSAFNYAK